MPSKLHDYVAEQMNDIIREQLKDFKGLLGTRTAQIAKNLYGIGSADIKFPSRIRGKENKKSPDKSYGHRPCKGYPALVIEVAWSQRPLDLPKLAKRYMADLPVSWYGARGNQTRGGCHRSGSPMKG
jgi:Uma2 family endonuclease